MNASVIVPTRNRCDSLVSCVESLLQQDEIRDHEVLVVDNGSSDATPVTVDAMMHRLPGRRLRYINEPIPGLLSGRHRGVLESEAEILVFVDDDVVVGSGWLSAILDAFDDPTVQLVGGPSRPIYEVDPPHWVRHFWTHDKLGMRCEWLSLLDLGDVRRVIDANYIWGLNLAIRRQALMTLGGFHPDNVPKELQRFQGDGETGLTMAANEAGYLAVYVPDALVHHRIPNHRLTPRYFEERAFYQGVCDSYFDARTGASRTGSDYLAGSTPSRRVALRFPKKPWILRRRFRRAQRAGYLFHQRALERHPGLIDWVRKEDYWDYALPDLHVQA